MTKPRYRPVVGKTYIGGEKQTWYIRDNAPGPGCRPCYVPTDENLHLLTFESREEAQAKCDEFNADQTCPDCNGRGWPLDDAEYLKGGAPHGECLRCEGTGQI